MRHFILNNLIQSWWNQTRVQFLGHYFHLVTSCLQVSVMPPWWPCLCWTSTTSSSSLGVFTTCFRWACGDFSEFLRSPLFGSSTWAPRLPANCHISFNQFLYFHFQFAQLEGYQNPAYWSLNVKTTFSQHSLATQSVLTRSLYCVWSVFSPSCPGPSAISPGTPRIASRTATARTNPTGWRPTPPTRASPPPS